MAHAIAISIAECAIHATIILNWYLYSYVHEKKHVHRLQESYFLITHHEHAIVSVFSSLPSQSQQMMQLLELLPSASIIACQHFTFALNNYEVILI